jgi:hypothetical protein
MVVEGLAHCLRHEKTAKEAQHLLAFSLLHMQQTKVRARCAIQTTASLNEYFYYVK